MVLNLSEIPIRFIEQSYINSSGTLKSGNMGTIDIEQMN
jgi:hypothetical protein